CKPPMLRLDTFIVAEFVSMLNFFYKKMPGSRLATPTFIIEPIYPGGFGFRDFFRNLTVPVAQNVWLNLQPALYRPLWPFPLLRQFLFNTLLPCLLQETLSSFGICAGLDSVY
ncbi:MAG: hypothetical protein UIJ88_02545, partial [Anaerovoracaceae bacterium]|nr:hypothetical protein [Anaerovoracaceae bacterium]